MNLDDLFGSDEIDFAYNENEKCSCHWCEWKGMAKQTKKRYINSSPSSWRSLAGREGFEYDCPKCGMTLIRHYTKIS